MATLRDGRLVDAVSDANLEMLDERLREVDKIGVIECL